MIPVLNSYRPNCVYNRNHHTLVVLLTFQCVLDKHQAITYGRYLNWEKHVLTNQRIIHSTIKLRLQYVVLVHYTTDYKTRNSWFNMASKYIAGVGTDIENSCSILEPPDILTASCTFVPIFFHHSNFIPQMIFLHIWNSVLK